MDYQSFALEISFFHNFRKFFANFSQFSRKMHILTISILDVQFKYILALVNMAATVSYSCYNAESRFQVCPRPIPGPSSLFQPRAHHIESILSQVQMKYSPLKSPPVRIWSTIWTEVNQGSSDRAEKGSEAQTGNEPRFFQGHFLKLKISFSLTINYINS